MSEALHADRDDPTAVTTLVVGAVAAILLAVLIIGLEVLFYKTAERERMRKVIAVQPQELRQVQIEQIETLTGYRWVDRDKGLVAIPIDDAMKLLVEDAQRSAPRPGGRR